MHRSGGSLYVREDLGGMLLRDVFGPEERSYQVGDLCEGMDFEAMSFEVFSSALFSIDYYDDGFDVGSEVLKSFYAFKFGRSFADDIVEKQHVLPFDHVCACYSSGCTVLFLFFSYDDTGHFQVAGYTWKY